MSAAGAEHRAGYLDPGACSSQLMVGAVCNALGEVGLEHRGGRSERRCGHRFAFAPRRPRRGGHGPPDGRRERSAGLLRCGDSAGGLGTDVGAISAAISRAAWSEQGVAVLSGPGRRGDERGDGDRVARREPPRARHDLQRRDREGAVMAADGSFDGERARRTSAPRPRTRCESRGSGGHHQSDRAARASRGEARPDRGWLRCRRRDPRGRNGRMGPGAQHRPGDEAQGGVHESVIHLRAEGAQADAALSALVDFVRRDFDEDPAAAPPAAGLPSDDAREDTAEGAGGSGAAVEETPGGRTISAVVASPGLAIGVLHVPARSCGPARGRWRHDLGRRRLGLERRRLGLGYWRHDSGRRWLGPGIRRPGSGIRRLDPGSQRLGPGSRRHDPGRRWPGPGIPATRLGNPAARPGKPAARPWKPAA